MEQPVDRYAADSVDLVRRAQDGDLAAYEQLFSRYYERTLGIVRQRLGGKLRETLESGDILQDAMVHAIRAFDRFEVRDESGLIGWFAVLIENRIRAAAKYHRAEKRDQQRQVILGHIHDSIASGRLQLEPQEEGPSPSSIAAHGEDRQRLAESLSRLDERDRAIIRLRQQEGRSWEETAELCGHPSPDAARMAYARAMVRLKKAMQRPG